MNRSRPFARPLLDLLPPIIGLALVAYFGFHAAYGERGLVSLRELQRETAAKSGELDALQDTEARLRRRVELISGPEIDGDILEEEARRTLGWSRPDEVVILHGLPERRVR